MKRVVFSLLTLFVLPAALAAKGDTVKIVITGAGLGTPLDIKDAGVVEFDVWSGPGCVHDGVEETEGFIIDWQKGILADKPTGLRHYEVAFYTWLKGQPPVYVVLYDYDPSKEQGFVYLPGQKDDLFRFNHVMWHGDGYEGHWLSATPAWEQFARPRIAKALSR
jgi:hypothetical protein